MNETEKKKKKKTLPELFLCRMEELYKIFNLNIIYYFIQW